MIEINNLTKTFGNDIALDAINLHVKKGAIYALAGPNGAGKTTLLNHLSGVYRQNSGDVLVKGQAVFENPTVKQRIFCINDDNYFPFMYSAKRLKNEYKNAYENFSEELFNSLSEIFTGININKALFSMSKGMKKQVLFWIALACRADILLLDEPFDGLDPIVRRKIWAALLAQCAERQTTIIISSHNLRELENACSDIAILNKGKLVLKENIEKLTQDVFKLQIALNDGEELPKLKGEIIAKTQNGKMQTLIIKGSSDEINTQLSAIKPSFFTISQLSLEDIFIHLLGGVNFEIDKILF